MNHKKFGKLLTEISKMTKKHFSPSQVIGLTEKFSEPVAIKHDVIEVKDKNLVVDQSKVKTKHIILSLIQLLCPSKKQNPKSSNKVMRIMQLSTFLLNYAKNRLIYTMERSFNA